MPTFKILDLNGHVKTHLNYVWCNPNTILWQKQLLFSSNNVFSIIGASAVGASAVGMSAVGASAIGASTVGSPPQKFSNHIGILKSVKSSTLELRDFAIPSSLLPLSPPFFPHTGIFRLLGHPFPASIYIYIYIEVYDNLE